MPCKIPLHQLLHKHREVIVEREGRAPISESLLMQAFGMGTSSQSIYKFGSKVASTVMKPFTKDEKITNGPGLLKNWTASRNFLLYKRNASVIGLSSITKEAIQNDSKS